MRYPLKSEFILPIWKRVPLQIQHINSWTHFRVLEQNSQKILHSGRRTPRVIDMAVLTFKTTYDLKKLVYELNPFC